MKSFPLIPAAFFGIVLGLVGLGNTWRVASRLWRLPAAIGETIMLLAIAVWAVVVVLYAAKWFFARAEARAEWEHPVLCCFVGLAPVATMLVALAVLPYARVAAVALFGMGAAGQLGFGVFRTGHLWTGGRDPLATTPVLYLPTVAGSFVSAIVAGALGWSDLGRLFFGAGLFSWLALESVIIGRFYLLAEMPAALRPTFGIQLAPPTVGCVAYLAGPVDLFAEALLGYGLLQALILARLVPWIARRPFAPGYWAFTFGVAALSLAALRLVERGLNSPAFVALAVMLFIVANAVIGGIGLGSVWLLARGRLLPAPLLAAPALVR